MTESFTLTLVERRGNGEVPDRDTGQAFVAETFDLDDAGRMSGLFAAHWESEDEDPSGRWSIDGPEDVSLDDALSWARERSNAILVQVGGGAAFYSAGTTDLTYDGGDEDDPVPVLPWPDGGLTIAARPVRTALDGSEQIVLWRVHVRDVRRELWDRVAALLNADDLVVRVEEPSDPAQTADVIVRGNGSEAVFLPLFRLIERVLGDLGHEPYEVGFNLSMRSEDQRDVD